MSLQEFADARINVPLHEVVVRAESIEPRDLDGHGLTHDVFEFVDRMLWDGRYPRSAMPRDAVRCAAIHYFVMMFDGDDLFTFVESTGWDPALREDIREGLKQFGFDGIGAVFADFEDFVERAGPEWFENANYEDPGLLALETRLEKFLPFEDVYDRLADVMKGAPYVRGVPAAQYQDVLKEISERNRS